MSIWMDEQMFTPGVKRHPSAGARRFIATGVIQMLLNSSWRIACRCGHCKGFTTSLRCLVMPALLVLTLAGTVSLADMVWSGRESLSARVGMELERLCHDPLLAFVPAALTTAEPSVRLLVAFLNREFSGPELQRGENYLWLTALHQAARGHADGVRTLDALQKEVEAGDRLF